MCEQRLVSLQHGVPIPDIEASLTPQGWQPGETPGLGAFPGQGTQKYATSEGLLESGMAVGLSGRRGLRSQYRALPSVGGPHPSSGWGTAKVGVNPGFKDCQPKAGDDLPRWTR